MNANPADTQQGLQDVHFIAVERFHQAVRQSLTKAENRQIASGVLDNLNMISRRIQQIRSFKGRHANKRIGVFGPPKRGKSTLLNVLLGEDILPTGHIPMSNTVVEIAHKQEEDWVATIHHDDGFQETRHPRSAEEVAQILEMFGSHRGKAVPAERIQISRDFSESPILRNGGVLIDTPGAETAFEGKADDLVSRDTKRALDILDSTHVVVFCVRADQLGNQAELDFYEQHLRRRRPLNVVNYSDLWTDPGDPLLEACARYRFARERCLLVSGKQAHMASLPKDGSGPGDGGIRGLEKVVLREVEELSPVQGLIACVRELTQVLESHRELFPSKAAVTGLVCLVKDQWKPQDKQILGFLSELQELHSRG